VSGRRFKVLQVGKFYPPHMGGIETHLEALCGELRTRFDVEVVAAKHRPDQASGERLGIKVTRLDTPFSITSAPVNPGLPAVIRRTAPDLLHIHLPHPGGVLGLLASGYRGPLVVTYHSDVVRQRIMGGIFRPFLDRVMGRASAIIATSRGYMDSSPVLQAHAARCRIVPYGIAVERFDASGDPRVNDIRRTCGPRLVLAVGRLVYYKGFDVLLDAMRSVDARLLLIGDGPLRPSLEAQARASGVHHKITFLGELQNDEAAPYFAAADMFVLPSVARSEAFGIVQLEAMANGTPVINTSLASGVPGVSLHDVSGLTVPPHDAPALAVAMNRLFDEPSLRARFSAAARQRVRDEFRVELMGERVAAIYDDALDARGDARGAA